MDLDDWQGKPHKNRRKNRVQNVCVANCCCVVLATPVNYDGHFALPANPHARTHARTGVHVHGSVTWGFIFNKKQKQNLSYLCPCRQLNCGSWPKPVCSSLFCLHRSTGSRCTPGMSPTSQKQVFFWGGGNVVCIPRTGHCNLLLV